MASQWGKPCPGQVYLQAEIGQRLFHVTSSSRHYLRRHHTLSTCSRSSEPKYIPLVYTSVFVGLLGNHLPAPLGDLSPDIATASRASLPALLLRLSQKRRHPNQVQQKHFKQHPPHAHVPSISVLPHRVGEFPLWTIKLHSPRSKKDRCSLALKTQTFTFPVINRDLCFRHSIA